MPLAAFASQEAISASRLYYWRARLREESQQETTAPAFFPVKVQRTPQDRPSENQAPSIIEIVVPNGRMARVIGIVHPDELRRVLALIDGQCAQC